MSKASAKASAARSKPVTAASSSSGARRNYKTSSIAPYLFVSPFYILFAIFGVFPLFFSLYLGFNEWDPAAGLASMKFVGLQNFADILDDERFFQSLWNTIYLAIASGVPQHVVAIPLAFFLHTAFKRWRNLTVGIYFLPNITSTVAIALVFSTLFSTQFGIINVALGELAKLPVIGPLFPDAYIDWLGNKEFIKPAVSIVVFWRFVGFNTVLYLASLQAIPSELYEAAAMDGASKWRQFWHVTLPLLRPMMMFASILTVIGNLQLIEEPFVLFGASGGANNAAMTTALYSYNTAFGEAMWGMASAIAWIMFIIIGFFTWLTYALFARGGMNDALKN
jgi:multiple sugar transport system permease protein